MADSLSFLSRTVNAWEVIPNSEKMIMLIGNNYTGRSTLAELIDKYQYGVTNQHLIFQKDKYSCQNIISAKSTKLQTTLPNFYRQKDGEDGISIVDVPSYILTPQTKKWSAYQQKLTITLMSQKKSSVGFLLFIQQKNTRSNVTSWIKIFFSFLDIFKQYPKQLLNSIGWVISKCESNITEEAVVKRLRFFQASLKKQKNIDGEIIDRIFDSIVENQRYFIFRKCTENQKEQEQIRAIYKKFPNLANYQFSKQNLKETGWTQDEEKNILEPYFQECQQNVAAAINCVYNCMLLQKWDASSFEQQKAKQFKRNAQTQLVSEQIQKKCKKKSTNIQIGSLIEAIAQFTQYLNMCLQQQKGEVSQLSNIISKFPSFIYEDNSEVNKYFFQRISEALSFKRYTKREMRFKKIQNLLEKFITSGANQFSQRLIAIKKQNDNQAFYEACIKFLQTCEVSGGSKQFLEDCKQSVLKFRNPKQLLTKVAKDLENIKDQKKLFDAILKIASAFQKLGTSEQPKQGNSDYLREASRIFKLALCPGNAIICLQSIEKEQTVSDAEQLIRNFVQACLFDSAKKTCHLKAAKFMSSRPVFGKLLAQAIQEQRKFMTSGSKYNLLLEEPVISAKDVEAIRKKASQIAKIL